MVINVSGLDNRQTHETPGNNNLLQNVEKGGHLRSNGERKQRQLHSTLTSYGTSGLWRDRDDGETGYSYARVLGKSGKASKANVFVTDSTYGNDNVTKNEETLVQLQPSSSANCTEWDISYITEIKPQYYYYPSSSKSGKGRRDRKLGKSDKIITKQVEVKKQVKTCVSNNPLSENLFTPSSGKSGKFAGKSSKGKSGKSGSFMINQNTSTSPIESVVSVPLVSHSNFYIFQILRHLIKKIIFDILCQCVQLGTKSKSYGNTLHFKTRKKLLLTIFYY
jgi:hypothetical protein